MEHHRTLLLKVRLNWLPPTRAYLLGTTADLDFLGTRFQTPASGRLLLEQSQTTATSARHGIGSLQFSIFPLSRARILEPHLVPCAMQGRLRLSLRARSRGSS